MTRASGHSATVTVGDVTIPVRSWEMMADDIPEAAFLAVPVGDWRILSDDADADASSWSGTFQVAWHPPQPRRFVARSRRLVAGVWATVKAY